MPELGSLLERLEEAQLLRRLEGASAYTFKHALTQETAYGSLLKNKRREIHRRVAWTLEELYPSQLDEYAALLAEHYAQAGDRLKTIEYSTRAGDASARVYANVEAIAHYSRALEQLEALSGEGTAATASSAEQILTLYTARGRALELAARYPEALDNYDALAAWAERHGERRLLLHSLMLQSPILNVPTSSIDLATGRAILEQALDLARELGDLPAEARILWNQVPLYTFSNEARQGQKAGEESLAIARALGLREQMAYTLNDLTTAYIPTGDLARAQEGLEEAREVWREMHNIPMLADSLTRSCSIAILMGEYDAALRWASEARELSESIGNLWGQSFSRMYVSQVYADRGEPAQAIQSMNESAAFGEKAGFVAPQLWKGVELAGLYLELGANELALEHARQAITIPNLAKSPLLHWAKIGHIATLVRLRRLEEAQAELDEIPPELRGNMAGRAWPSIAITAALIRGELALIRNDPEEALACAEEMLSFTAKSGIRYYRPDLHELKGRALSALGRSGAAEQALAEGVAEATPLGSRRTLWRLQAALARAAEVRGDLAAADRLYRAAREHVEYIAAHTGSLELTASFLNLPQVRTVLENTDDPKRVDNSQA